MSSDARCSIYIGNLDEKVTDKILYDILIQAGRVLDLHIPRDRDTDEPKGFAFAEYESEEVADYAVKLFSGLVTLYNRTLKFAISGQDKPLQNGGPNGLLSASNLLNKPRSHPRPNSGFETSHQTGFSTPRRESAYSFSGPIDPPGVVHHHNGYNGTNYDSGRRLFGSAVEAISGPRSHRYDSVLHEAVDSIEVYFWRRGDGKWCRQQGHKSEIFSEADKFGIIKRSLIRSVLIVGSNSAKMVLTT